MTWLPEPLVGARIRLTVVQQEDVPDLVRLWTDEKVRQYLGGPLPPDEAHARAELVVGAPNVFLVERVEDEAVLGLCTLGTHRTGSTEVSYEFFPTAWGKGYAREAVAMTVRWAFERMNLDRLIAVTQTSNARSCRLLTAVGMTETDRFLEFGAEQACYSVPRS